MSSSEKPARPQILYSCYAHTSRSGEQFVPEHVFSYNVSGTNEIYLSNKTYIFKEGDFRFFRKNQLAKFSKQPPPGGEFKAVSVFLGKDVLHSLSIEHNLHAEKPYTGEAVLNLKPNALFQNYMASLTPYLDENAENTNALTTLKVKEAVMILLQTNPDLKNILFDFSEPGKIDLEAYMSEHYKFNVELSHFAYLTGRSLATFKRDFDRIFHMPPNKWLQQKRLQDAWYLIKERGQKSSDVYLEVGFKDLSHFSFAFKRAFGMAPTKAIENT